MDSIVNTLKKQNWERLYILILIVVGIIAFTLIIVGIQTGGSSKYSLEGKFNNALNLSYNLDKVVVNAEGISLKPGVDSADVILLDPIDIPSDAELIEIDHIATIARGNRISYQISGDSNTWYFFDGQQWSPAGNCEYCSNGIEEINEHLDSLRVAGGEIRVKALLTNTGEESPILSSVSVTVESSIPETLFRSGQVQGEESDPVCECEGGMTTLTVQYSGPDGVTVKLSKKRDRNYFKTFNNVQNGDLLTVTKEDADSTLKLPSDVWYTVLDSSYSSSCYDDKCGDDVTKISIHTSCSVDVDPGDVFGNFTVVSYEDKAGNECPGDPDPNPTECQIPPAENRIIVEFPQDLIRADRSFSDAILGPVSASIPAGTYTVTLNSYDDHSGHGGQGQPAESWLAILRDGTSEVVRSNSISDIPEDQDVVVEVVDTNLVVSTDVDNIKALHAAYPSSDPNSVYPICAAFDPIVTNLPPIAEDDTSTTTQCSAVEIPILDNDYDPDGNLVLTSYSTVDTPDNGQVSYDSSTGISTYTPDCEFTGTDTFIYEICDDGPTVMCDTATVTIDVDPPTATCVPLILDYSGKQHGTILTEQYAADGIHLSAQAYGGRPNSMIVFNSNASGTADPDLEVGIGNLSIIPENVTDSNGDGLVDSPNDSSRGGIQVFNFDHPRLVKTIVAVDIETTQGEIRAYDSSNTLLKTVGLTGAGDGGVQTVEINANYVSRLEIDYPESGAWTDLDLECTTELEPPVAVDDFATVDEYSSVDIDILANDYDTDGVLVPSTTVVVTPPGNGDVTINSTNGVATYSPDPGFTGIDTFEYKVCDDDGLCDIALVTITVEPVLAIKPILECVEYDEGLEKYEAFFGYQNDNTVIIDIPVSFANEFNPSPADRGQPTQFESGRQSFVFTVLFDGSPLVWKLDSRTATASSGSKPCNYPPVAEDDFETTMMNTPVDIDVLTNDSDPDGVLDPGSVQIVGSPSNGTVTNINPATGVNTYTPNPGFYGVDDYDYKVCDDQGKCDTATVTVTVLAPPIANDDYDTTDENVPVTIDILFNDSDPDGFLVPASVTLISGPANGNVSFNTGNGEATYTPNSGYTGTDTFVYEVCDNDNLCDQATVTITIVKLYPPVANDDSDTTDQDTPVTVDILANDSDVDGVLVESSVKTVTPPSHGSVSYDPTTGAATYTPDSGYYGIDTWDYEVCDDDSLCDTATVTITIIQLFPPIANNDSATTLMDTPVTLDVLNNDYDPDGVLDFGTLKEITPPANGTASYNTTTGESTYTPNPGFIGIDTYVYEICDDDGLCDTATVTIGVNPPLVPPVAQNDSETTDQDVPVTVDVLANDSDADGVIVPATTHIVSPPANGTITNINSLNGEITYQPNSAYTGIDTFVYEVCDNDGLCDSATVTITIEPGITVFAHKIVCEDETDLPNWGASGGPNFDENTAANFVAEHENCRFQEDWYFQWAPISTPNPGDNTGEAGDPWTTFGPTNNMGMTQVSIPASSVDTKMWFREVLEDGYIGFTYNEDPQGNSDDVSAEFYCHTDVINYDNYDFISNTGLGETYYCIGFNAGELPPPVPPVAQDDATTTPQDTPVWVDVLVNDYDPDGTLVPSTVTETVAPNNGAVTNINTTTGEMEYTPNTGFYGVDTFEYEVCDNDGLCDDAKVTITVEQEIIKLPPIAGDDFDITDMNVPVTTDILANDSDPDGVLVPATTKEITPPTNGSVSYNLVNGEATYTPNNGFYGIDTYVYEICDDDGLCDTATVTILINQLFPPVADNDFAVTDEDVPVTIDILLNDSDVDGILVPSTVKEINPPSNGSVSYNLTNGEATYTPNTGYVGTDNFEYEICDNDGLCDTAVVTVQIDSLIPPVAVDDTAFTPFETPIEITILSNDSDADGVIVPATTTEITPPTNGTVTIDSGTGNATYTPDAGFSGVDTFVYEVCDDDGLCDTATVTVTVGEPELIPPVAVDDFATTPFNTPVLVPNPDNDSDADGVLDLGSVTVIIPPVNGGVTIDPTTGEATYTPNVGFFGTDTLIYQICDDDALCDIALITITVDGPPIIPPPPPLPPTEEPEDIIPAFELTGCQPVFGANQFILASQPSPISGTGIVQFVEGETQTFYIEATECVTNAQLTDFTNNVDFPLEYNPELKLWETELTFDNTGFIRLVAQVGDGETAYSREINTIFVSPMSAIIDIDTGEPITGVTITVFAKDDTDSFVVWNGEAFGVANPFVTDGNFSVVVPQGEYFLQVEHPDYDIAQSLITEVEDQSIITAQVSLRRAANIFTRLFSQISRGDVANNFSLNVTAMPILNLIEVGSVLPEIIVDTDTEEGIQLFTQLPQDRKSLIMVYSSWNTLAQEQIEIFIDVASLFSEDFGFAPLTTLEPDNLNTTYINRGEYDMTFYKPNTDFFDDYSIISLPQFFLVESDPDTGEPVLLDILVGPRSVEELTDYLQTQLDTEE